MIPLHDVHKPQRAPFVTRLLVALNVAAFVYQGLTSLLGGGQVAASLGVRPGCYFSPSSCGLALTGGADGLLKPLAEPLFASLFLHGGLLHLAFNMLFLWVFGPGVEDRLGRFKFSLLYFGCGILAGLAHILTHPLSMAPAIGASGAIAGVLGAYLLLLPRSWILTYFPPIFFFPVPAPLFLIAWIALQIAGAFSGLGRLFGVPLVPSGENIAWMAHLGGFAAGLFIGWKMRPGQRAASPIT